MLQKHQAVDNHLFEKSMNNLILYKVSSPIRLKKKQYLKIKYHPLIPSLVNEKNESKISFFTFFSSFHILGFVFLLRWVLSSKKFLVLSLSVHRATTEANKSDIFKEGNLTLFVCSGNTLWAYYVNSMKDYYYYFLKISSLSLSVSLSLY